MRLIKLGNEPIRTSAVEVARAAAAAEGREFTQPVISIADALVQVVETREEGMSLSDLRTSLRIIDALRADPAVAYMEEAEWKFLCARLEGHKFPFACSAFLKVVDAAMDAPEVDLHASKGT